MPPIANSPFFVSCDETFSGRSGKPVNAVGERNYVRQFLVVVKDKNMGPISVLLAPGIPRPGSIYQTALEYDTNALALEYDAKPQVEDDWSNWLVTVNYSTKVPPGGPQAVTFPNDPSGTQDHPELEPADIEWDFETIQIAPQFDLNGRPFLNTAGQPFSPQPTFPMGIVVLRITRNEIAFDSYKAALYAYAVNSDWFLGCAPGTVQCMPPKAKRAHRGNLFYSKTTYNLKFNYIVDSPMDPDFVLGPDGLPHGMKTWQPRIISSGSMYLGGASGVKLMPILDNHSQRTTDLLDEDGARIPFTGDPPIKVPYYIQFRMYRSLSFVSLLVNGLA